ncbi:hypothetical protein LOC68_20070 [Blastopirellula sp. JC732]|uniref:Uncharacterized protein n=1 Tax=Blastopirellula sediminis TaxID=2894196 RepID=A0A9X1MP10_9BACT|nr:hypothetical protein [Blastopirellula sediminis]MCC9606003.1 hypothetical protein [Blastopirellula sediminis]MCC9630698.1 hypothetical protein [Blastopirellula sediminis]
MAKKNGKPKMTQEEDGADRVRRKEPYSSERIARVVDRLREQAGRLSSLVRSMEEAELDDVVVDGHAMLLRGLNQVDNFADNTARAVREARTAKFE